MLWTPGLPLAASAPWHYLSSGYSFFLQPTGINWSLTLSFPDLLVYLLSFPLSAQPAGACFLNSSGQQGQLLWSFWHPPDNISSCYLLLETCSSHRFCYVSSVPALTYQYLVVSVFKMKSKSTFLLLSTFVLLHTITFCLYYLLWLLHNLFLFSLQFISLSIPANFF